MFWLNFQVLEQLEINYKIISWCENKTWSLQGYIYNWAKSTQRYYGLSWCKEPCDNAIINFNNLASFLPPDIFVISNTLNNIIVGYFTGYLVNGNRAMIEINIFSEATHFQT
jgi:hypothetical protein